MLVARLRAAGCVFAEDEAALLVDSVGSPAAMEALLTRRIAGEPLEHVVGWASFAGRRYAVAPGVFVPRRRTELMVAAGVAGLAAHTAAHPPIVVDLCCGCGAVGAAIARRAGPIELHAVDIDAAAVQVARRNVAPVGGNVVQGDLDAPLPARLRGHVDLLVANAPYVPTGAIASLPREARDHEPQQALDGGTDGLAVLRRVVAVAGRWLAPAGALIVEAGATQADAVAAHCDAEGLAAGVVHDPAVDGTVVVARRPEAMRTA